jgi:hypothetical protein
MRKALDCAGVCPISNPWATVARRKEKHMKDWLDYYPLDARIAYRMLRGSHDDMPRYDGHVSRKEFDAAVEIFGENDAKDICDTLSSERRWSGFMNRVECGSQRHMTPEGTWRRNRKYAIVRQYLKSGKWINYR